MQLCLMRLVFSVRNEQAMKNELLEGSMMESQIMLSGQIGDLDLTVQDHTLAITQVKDRVTVLEAN